MDKQNMPNDGLKEPQTIYTVPHGEFSADLQTNLALIRSKLGSDRLKFKFLSVGKLNPKELVIAYLEGIAQPQLLERLITKINELKLDKLVGAGQLETLIKDFPRSLFPQFQATVKQDHAINNLLEGKFLILLEGTPVTLSAPVNFFDFFAKPDDLNYNWLFRPFIRFLRFLAMGLAIFLPALYVAIISFHFHIIPVNYLIPLAESRAHVPFPPIIEVLFLEIIIELLHESAFRFAPSLDPGIGILSVILLGVAAISTGMVSAVTVAVSMVTLIASLSLPPYDLGVSTRFFKFTALFFAALFGVLGFIVTASVTFAHLITLESLGQPYFQPLIPFKWENIIGKRGRIDGRPKSNHR
ncbi:spore germination protein [Capillibacterium thermochitinicola]|uniref:Spore germination protein n=1 Tax=Capillibacterium thermochitinicola TaxID=2699427 RepID=A0A8J6LHX9_9FIRM|nr:spore germination protein [Capillibacterium thermochitinicola]MBA2132680.1 spore germination protein [Capillibacterium thermochitinicola]